MIKTVFDVENKAIIPTRINAIGPIADATTLANGAVDAPSSFQCMTLTADIDTRT